ncbi:hypothetical protein BH10CHL1_BH10CHL1_31790 [soil metagenome]
MKKLWFSLLGQFQVTLDDQLVDDFQTDKARALLAYLVVEAERPHTRSQLAEMFWPGFTEASARTNLRRALSNIRKAVGEKDGTGLPLFLADGPTLQFNRHANYWLDIGRFNMLTTISLSTIRKQSSPESISSLEEAVALYRNHFLANLSLDQCPSFEEWLLLMRQHLQRKMLDALACLADYYIDTSNLELANQHIHHQLELDAYREEAHRQLIQLFLHQGNRSAALTQFERCQKILADQLGVEPAPETMALYQEILNPVSRRVALNPLLPPAPDPILVMPPFFSTYLSHVELAPPIVARQTELARLDSFLQKARTGQGQVVFLVGDAGQGKTALATEFARRAQEAVSDLVVASGNCNAHTGIGDPYLPFCEILTLLTGDVEAKWLAGALSRSQANRLWQLAPIAMQAVVELGADLVDTFIPASPLLTRAAAFAATGSEWFASLYRLVEGQQAPIEQRKLRQEQLFGQVTKVLQRLAQQHPLLLLIDDLQWGDNGSINLLFHIGRQLAGSRILIIGLYRATEVSLGRNGERHPLDPVVNELKRTFGDIEIDLNQARGQAFVDAFIDTEPNYLSTKFRTTLLQQTDGHALFTVELLRGMQERGDLIQDSQGYWCEGSTLDWHALPARVEAVIGERIGRLPEYLQRLLTVASAEGEFFTAEVVARILKIDETEVIQQLSHELDKRHRLVRAQGVQRVDRQRLSHYRFGHILFQRYLYAHLDPVERPLLHEAVATVLELIYAEQVENQAAQLAHHYEEAQIVTKTIHYLGLAVERALYLLANEEALTHLRKALLLLEQMPETPERRHKELEFRLRFGTVMLAIWGHGGPELLANYNIAYQLAQRYGDVTQRMAALWGLRSHYIVRSQNQKALLLDQEFLPLAEKVQSADLLVEAHRNIGFSFVHLGEFVQARNHFEQGLTFYDAKHTDSAQRYGRDTGVSSLNYLAKSLWMLGYPAQARQRTDEGLALAQSLSHPLSLAYAFNNSVHIAQLNGDLQTMQGYLEPGLALVQQHKFTQWIACGLRWYGWLLIQQGNIKKGFEYFEQGFALAEEIGFIWQKRHFLSLLADAHKSVHQIEAGLSVLRQALEEETEIDDQYGVPDLYRLKGELLLMQNAAKEGSLRTVEAIDEAIECFQQSLEIARSQQAKSLELRTAMSLSRLWHTQGRTMEAQQLLVPIYAWFTEGFDTHDLREAKHLLDALNL